MVVFEFIKSVFVNAFDGDSYAIVVIVLTSLLFISFLRRLSTAGKNEKSLEKIKALQKELNQFLIVLHTKENEILNLGEVIKRKGGEVNQLKTERDSLILELKEYVAIREKYTELYNKYNRLKQLMENREKQLHRFRLSPHVLKNLLNKTFLEATITENLNEAKASFSIFGKKYFSTKILHHIINRHNKTFETSLELLVDTLNYLIYGTQSSTVHVDTEIIQLVKFCKLIEINKGIRIEIDNDVGNNSLQIPPTILFNYIDNAIKHGFFGNNGILKINLNCINSFFEYTVTTPIHPKTKQVNEPGGMGNSMLRESLELYDDHRYSISNEIINNNHIAKLRLAI